MTEIEFSITFCCYALQYAVIKREFLFNVNVEDRNVIIIDNRVEENPLKLKSCPFCHRDPNDVIDLELE